MLDFLAKQEKSPEAYWSLVLEPDLIQAGVWIVGGQNIKLIATSPATPWSDEAELTGVVDTALSSCIQKLPEDFTEPSKTVFGVTSNWVSGAEIRQEYLAKIKNLCSVLTLTPAGFVVLPEAISHFYKISEGAPLNAVVVGLRNQDLEISIIERGVLSGSTQVARSVSVADDVLEGLSRFEIGDSFPSRIIIYNGKEGELDEAKNSLSAQSWEESDKVKFLHTPKIEILDPVKKIEAVSLAGATEMGGVKEPEPAKEETPVESLGFVVTPERLPEEEKVVTPPGPGLFEKFKKNVPKIPKIPRLKFPVFLIVFVVILLGLVSFWWFYPKATVIVYVSPKSFEEEFEVKFDSKEITEVSISGEKTINTSGVKLVGERAKGSVQIRNGTAQPINLLTGTILLSAGDLKFSLDNSASVSAALSPGAPGTTVAQVSAYAIGAEYNLAKDETFKIGNYPKAEVDAIASTNFSGGSSKEIPAVSLEDQKKLKEELDTELIGKAKSELSQKASDQQFFIPELVSFEDSDISYNHKVGDEADNLKLSILMKIRGVITDKKGLADSVREKIKDKIPQGFVLRDNQISYEFKFNQEDPDGKLSYQITAKVNFLPEIKEDEIRKQIAGRSPSVVENYLKSIPGFSGAEIKLKPRFPGRFGTLPRIKKNITIEIASE